MPASPSISDSASQSSQHDPLRERVSTAFEKLVASATELNAISDEIAKPIATIEATLQRLNLGVWAWAKFAGETDLVAGYFWDRSIGYAKVSRVWGIAIRARSGPLELVTPERTETETWRFNDAPRSYRIQAADGETVSEQEWRFNDEPRELRLEALEKPAGRDHRRLALKNQELRRIRWQRR